MKERKQQKKNIEKRGKELVGLVFRRRQNIALWGGECSSSSSQWRWNEGEMRSVVGESGLARLVGHLSQ